MSRQDQPAINGSILNCEETIFAVASGQGRAGVCVVRVSGACAGEVLQATTGRVPLPRRATLSRIVDPATGEVIDTGLVLWFPGPASFTGEDCAEMQVHGGRAVVASLIQALGKMSGLRFAEPGEFTRRAFGNGRMDLAQVEGLADLIDSETEQQRKQALSQLQGALGKKTEAWRRSLLEALSLVEASIDFSDEGDAPKHVMPKVLANAHAVLVEIDALLARGNAGERLRDGLLVVIAGPPNAGKSSLLNFIAEREVAIVSPLSGTTRDPLVVQLDIGGYPVQLVDTAGLRKAKNSVEAIGIERAQAYLERADLVLWLSEKLPRRAALPMQGHGEVWDISTKCDLVPTQKGDRRSRISSTTGEGVNELLLAIGELAARQLGSGGMAEVTRERHRIALKETRSYLSSLLQSAGSAELELIAEDLRLASRALGSIVGQVGVEEVLGEIFSRFCIGK